MLIIIKKIWQFFSAVSTIHSLLILSAFFASLGIIDYLTILIEKYLEVGQFLIYIITAIIFFVLAIFAYLSEKLNKFSRYTPSLKRINPDFEVEKMSLTLDLKKAKFVKSKVLKARKKVESYTDHYRWSGSKATLKSGIQGHEISLSNKTGPQAQAKYSIVFNGIVQKNESVKTEVIIDLEGIDNSKPHLGQFIKEPTEILEFKVELPENLTCDKAVLNHYEVDSALSPYHTETINFDRNGLCNAKVSKPKLFHYYEISWNADEC